MTCNVEKTVGQLKKKYKLSHVTESSVSDILKAQGYTVVYFNAIVNDENVSQIISNLRLEEAIIRHKGFTYSDDKYRLVFVNEDLSAEERLIVLAHEEGHIACGHMNDRPIVGRDVRQEHEANEFTHYLLHPGGGERFGYFISAHKALVISLCACVLVIAAGVTAFAVLNKNNVFSKNGTVSTGSEEEELYGEYYVTSNGNKYHEKDCIHVKNKSNVRRLTKKEFESGEYEPCQTCLPE